MNDDNTSMPYRTSQKPDDGEHTGRAEEENDLSPKSSRAIDPTRSRRRFLQVASVAGIGALAGCSISVDESGIHWGDDGDDTSTQTPAGTSTDQPTEDQTDTPEPTPEETDTPTPEPTPKPTADTYRVGDFQVTSNYGDIDVYGKISMRGIYDEDEYINPVGHSTWEVWERDEDGSLSIDEGVPRNVVGVDETIEFPPSVVADLDEHEPFIIVRVDLGRRREALSNQFLGWDSTSTYLDELESDPSAGQVEMQFTGEGNDVTMSYSVTSVYE